MNLARADTYINVYLPRPDGEDPRRYAAPTSPMFEESTMYKFSDQIQKDRPLFMGKKQMSLYEIYYKDRQGYVSLEKTNPAPVREERGEEFAPLIPQRRDEVVDAVEEDELDNNFNKENVRDSCEKLHSERQSELFPNLKKVSLSLDSKVKPRYYRRPQKMRFNEPLNAYVSNRKRAQTLTRFDPNSSIERQVTTFEFSPQNVRERTVYDYAYKTDNVSSPRLYKKSQSAPAEIRQIRSLGLPPISVSGNSRRSTRVPAVVLPIRQPDESIRVLASRPSASPHKVWRQTTDILTDRYTAKFSRIPQLRYEATRQQQSVDLTITSDSLLKSR